MTSSGNGILKKLAGESVIYGLSTILGRFINYLLVPLYTAVFAPEHFAVYSIMYAFAAFMNVIFSMGFETSYFRFSKDYTGTKVFSNLQSFIILSSIIGASLLFLGRDEIATWIGFPDYSKLIGYLSLIIGLDALVIIPFSRFRWEHKAFNYAGIKLFNILVNVGLNLIFFLFISEGSAFHESVTTFFNLMDPIEFIFIANLIASLITAILVLPGYKGFRPELNFEFLKPVLKYSWPIIVTGLAAMVNEMLDKFMLKAFLDDNFYPTLSTDAAIGVYSGVSKLAIFMVLIIQGFRFAAEPFFFSNQKEENPKENYVLVMGWFILVCAFFLAVISLGLPVLKYLLRNPDYWQGLAVVPLLLLGKLLLGIYYNLSVWYKVSDQTIYGTWFSIAGAVVTVIGNYLLIPVLGFAGSAITSVACYFTMVAFSAKVGTMKYPIPYHWKEAVILILLSAASIFIVMFLISFYPENELLISGMALLMITLIFLLAARRKRRYGNILNS